MATFSQFNKKHINEKRMDSRGEAETRDIVNKIFQQGARGNRNRNIKKKFSTDSFSGTQKQFDDLSTTGNEGQRKTANQ